MIMIRCHVGWIWSERRRHSTFPSSARPHLSRCDHLIDPPSILFIRCSLPIATPQILAPLSAVLTISTLEAIRFESMDAPSVPQSEPFPIGAAVAAGMVVFVLGIIITVYSLTERHRRRKPIGSVEAAEGSVDGRLQVQQRGVEIPEPEPHSRADGSTISISSPVAEIPAR
ncbi:hypothetical protein C8R44DRAFT_862113 [Mycena epipterygia]|nr:hypothetical protein C8R44DRAFT_862113 [Mycena epipterygia]